MTGASTVYLHLYVGLIVFKHNWKIDNRFPPTSMGDAERIYAELLWGNYDNDKVKLKNTDILTLKRPSTKYMKSLKELTEQIRKNTEEQGFTFDKNDRLITFNKHKYFRNLGVTKLRQICRTYGIKGYTAIKNKETLSGIICKLTEADDIFLTAVAADSVNSPFVEDLRELIRLSKLRNSDNKKG